MLYYFLSTCIASIAGMMWLLKRLEFHKLDQKIVLKGYLLVMISAFAGARLFHVIYEEPQYYAENWVRILLFWQGGFVYFGGFILALISALGYLAFMKVPNKLAYLDAAAPIISITYVIGRIGCFIVGCCYGKESDILWTVDHRHPTQLYAVIWDALLAAFLLKFEDRRPRAGNLFAIWAIGHGVGRFIMEAFRDDYRGEIYIISISSWISILLVIGGGILLWKKNLNLPTSK